MTYSNKKPQNPCEAELNCHYKVNNICVFWDRINVILNVMKKNTIRKEAVSWTFLTLIVIPALNWTTRSITADPWIFRGLRHRA